MVGTAKTSGIGGETIQVVISGISDQHNGLTIGKIYYGELSNLTIDKTRDRMGVAVSSTELLLMDRLVDE